MASGQGNAAYWLARFRVAYQAKTGLKLFPGSLNLRIDREVSLLSPEFEPMLLRMAAAEYGGERDILMLPCVLPSLGSTRALVWRTTSAEAFSEDRCTLELLAEISLRKTFGLADGDVVEVRIEAAPPPGTSG